MGILSCVLVSRAERDKETQEVRISFISAVTAGWSLSPHTAGSTDVCVSMAMSVQTCGDRTAPPVSHVGQSCPHVSCWLSLLIVMSVLMPVILVITPDGNGDMIAPCPAGHCKARTVIKA